MEKILSGWADYLLYGFANSEENGLRFAKLIGLMEFRSAYFGHLSTVASEGTEPLTIHEKGNIDGSSRFYSFYYSDFPEGLVIKTWNFAGYYGREMSAQIGRGPLKTATSVRSFLWICRCEVWRSAKRFSGSPTEAGGSSRP